MRCPFSIFYPRQLGKVLSEPLLKVISLLWTSGSFSLLLPRKQPPSLFAKVAFLMPCSFPRPEAPVSCHSILPQRLPSRSESLFLPRTTILAAVAFLEAFQRVADMATNTRGKELWGGKMVYPLGSPFQGLEGEFR